MARANVVLPEPDGPTMSRHLLAACRHPEVTGRQGEHPAQEPDSDRLVQPELRPPRRDRRVGCSPIQGGACRIAGKDLHGGEDDGEQRHQQPNPARDQTRHQPDAQVASHVPSS